MAPPRIDPRALVHAGAELAEDVVVGPYAVIESGVVIGAGTTIAAHAYLCRGTLLGRENAVHMGAVLGHEPQDFGYRGAATRFVAGDRNVFREGCHVHRATAEGSETVVGDDCYLMTNTHVAHNCRVGSGAILATGAVIGGHVEVGERAFLSGNCVVHQHVRIGRLALVQGGGRLSRDVPPFLIAGDLNRLRAVNVVGLRRAGFEASQIAALRRLYRVLFGRRHNLRLARERFLSEEAARGGASPEALELLAFIDSSRRGICAAGTRFAALRGVDPEAP